MSDSQLSQLMEKMMAPTTTSSVRIQRKRRDEEDDIDLDNL